jgi:hypothetical protein
MVILAVAPLLAIGVTDIAYLRLVLREAALERLDLHASVKARAIEKFLEGVQFADGFFPDSRGVP